MASCGWPAWAAMAACQYTFFWSQAGTSGWSAPFDFECGPEVTPPSAPTGLGATGTDTATPTILWDPDATADYYAIWYVEADTGNVISGATNLTTASYTHGSNLDDGNYRFWVRAANGAGSSPFAGPYDFTVHTSAAPSWPAYGGGAEAFFPNANGGSRAAYATVPQAEARPHTGFRLG